MDIDSLFRLATGERSSPLYVGPLLDPLPVVIGAMARSIHLSSETMRKQLARHGDIPLACYEHLPWIIANGDPLVDRWKTNVLHIVADCRYLLGYQAKVTVKATLRGDEIWLTSFHKIRDRDVNRLKRRARESCRWPKAPANGGGLTYGRGAC